jgi:DNA-binding NarL/FixJ family response regulator
MVRAGFGALLAAQPDIDVVGDAADGAQAVAEVAAHAPDVVLMDVRMPVMDGLEAVRRILADAPERPRVLMLTTFDLDDYVYAALRAGASGFLLPDAPAAVTSSLTPRELDVLRLIARGLSNQEIAAELIVAEQTVKTHVSRILTKTGLRDRAQAVVLAYESGLVTANSR